MPDEVLRELGGKARELAAAAPGADQQALRSGKGTIETIREALQ